MFDDAPVLVFWETTKACLLSCVHCRAEAISRALPGELSTAEGFALIDQVAEFGEPKPTIVFTGGDPLMREDIFTLIEYAKGRGLRFAVSPSATPLLTEQKLKAIRDLGASALSISLDGPSPSAHDAVRRVEGTFERSVEAISKAVSLGLNVQVNTTVMRSTVFGLPELFHLVRRLGVKVWEVFFLIKVGRGVGVEDLSATENESVLNFLYDASRYGVVVRTVEAPFIRRVLRMREELGEYWGHQLYLELRARLTQLEGEPATQKTTISPRGTLDGDGTIFVGYDGTVYPGGLVPYPLGNVRSRNLVHIYREDPTLQKIRRRMLGGACGRCEYRGPCGGSRARAYAAGRDPLAPDPGCLKAAAMGVAAP